MVLRDAQSWQSKCSKMVLGKVVIGTRSYRLVSPQSL